MGGTKTPLKTPNRSLRPPRQCKPIYDEFPAVEEGDVLYQPF
jgi:hypothetical protein